MIVLIMLFIPINVSDKEKIHCPDHSGRQVSGTNGTKKGPLIRMAGFPIFSVWERWFANEQRAEHEGKVDTLIGSPTIYKPYSYY